MNIVKEITNNDTVYYDAFKLLLDFKKNLDTNNNNIIKADHWNAYPIKINSNDYLKIKPFVDILIKNVENILQKSCTDIGKIVVVKTFTSNKQINTGAFVWHWDNGPPDILDILVYLNNVDQPNCGEFEYLTKLVDNVYVPDINTYFKDRGGMRNINLNNKKINKFLGKEGDYVIFQNNVSHRASTPIIQNRYRLSIQIQLN
tara:strand:+ start:891 stop:1496 length:606 start_codon:yes stop_codon:yes gene_type:complete